MNATILSGHGVKTMRKCFLFLALAAMTACASDINVVDRTQPNKIEKSLLEGEWYFRPTVVEVDYNQGMLFEGYAGEMERIRWDIREDQIIAYRSYELLEGAETGTGAVAFQGNPLAVFPVKEHFDVFRDYNEATGEQKNVLVENTTDRPWYEREYMRVDWSQNLKNDPYMFESVVSAIAGASYYVQENDVDNPYRAEITAENINVVGSYLLETDLWTCYLVYQDPYFCGASEAKIRLSFMKVDPNNDYEEVYYPDNIPARDADGEPVYYCDGEGHNPDEAWNNADCSKQGFPVFERFGFFRTQRMAYDDEYQWTREGRIFLANLWNIWGKTRAVDVNPWDFPLACGYGTNFGEGDIIPKACRPPGQITYYTNAGFPTDPELWQATQEFMGEWDEAFRETIAANRRVYFKKNVRADDIRTTLQIRKNTCDVNYVRSYVADNGYANELREFGIDTVEAGNLKRACSVLEWASDGDFQWQKLGDLRHSFVNWVNTPQVAGPLGYGPSAADPVTGEIISATANIYGAAVDEYAAYAADVISLMNGDLDVYDIIDGGTIREHISTKKGRYNRGLSLNKMAAARSRDTRAFAASPQDEQQEGQFGGSFASQSRAKLERLQGSALEKELLSSDDIKRALLGPEGYQPGMDAADLAEQSPLEWLAEGAAERQKALGRLAEHSIMMAEWTDVGAESLVQSDFQDMTWEQIYAKVHKLIYKAVTAHEVGHTLGLRHNFSGSIDALNYDPKFWEDYEYNAGIGEGTVRRFNPNGTPTMATQYMYSSIMDYSARFWADDVQGIGPYDLAALKFGYGGLIEVFDEPVMGQPFNVSFINEYLYDYTWIPKLVGTGWTDYYSQDSEFYDWLPTAMRQATPKVDNIWKRSDVTFEEYVEKTSACYLGSCPFPPTPVPYMFCTDDRAGWWFDCQLYDHGANLREVTADRMERYDEYYMFTNFKRDRFGFGEYNGINDYNQRLLSRYLLPMWNSFNFYSYGFLSLDTNQLTGEAILLNEYPMAQGWQASAMDGLNYLASVMLHPEPGTYCLDSAANTYRLTGDLGETVTCATGAPIEVPLGVGKYLKTRWSNDYYYKPTHIGSFFDKWIATWAFTYDQGFFYQDFSASLDAGAFSYSYWRSLQPEMLDLFAPLLTGADNPFSWRVDATDPNHPEFKWTPVVDIYDDADWDAVADGALPTLESSTSWTLKYWSLVLPLVRFNSMVDYTLDFSDYARVCLEGYQDCMDISTVNNAGVVSPGVEGDDFVAYTDPLNGYRYIASSYPGRTDRRSIGRELVEDAQAYANEYLLARSRFDEVLGVNGGSFELADEEKTTFNADFYGDLNAGQKAQLFQQRRDDLLSKERGVNERSSFIDLVRNFARMTEFEY